MVVLPFVEIIGTQHTWSRYDFLIEKVETSGKASVSPTETVLAPWLVAVRGQKVVKWYTGLNQELFIIIISILLFWWLLLLYTKKTIYVQVHTSASKHLMFSNCEAKIYRFKIVYSWGPLVCPLGTSSIDWNFRQVEGETEYLGAAPSW